MRSKALPESGKAFMSIFQELVVCSLAAIPTDEIYPEK